jgi:hypothetical protein
MQERRITITLTEKDGRQLITVDPSGFSPLEVLGVLRYECLRHEAWLLQAEHEVVAPREDEK